MGFRTVCGGGSSPAWRARDSCTLGGGVPLFAGLGSSQSISPTPCPVAKGRGKVQSYPHLVAKGGGHFSQFIDMKSSSKDGPQSPAQGGAKISGDPALSVAAQGTEGGLATGVPGQEVGLVHGLRHLGQYGYSWPAH